MIPDAKTDLLIRTKSNRVIQGKQKLFDYLSRQPLQGTYTIELEVDKRRKIKKRTATVEVLFSKVSISAHQYADKDLPRSICLYSIEAKEAGQNI